jgi:hypothetical protein
VKQTTEGTRARSATDEATRLILKRLDELEKLIRDKEPVAPRPHYPAPQPKPWPGVVPWSDDRYPYKPSRVRWYWDRHGTEPLEQGPNYRMDTWRCT